MTKAWFLGFCFAVSASAQASELDAKQDIALGLKALGYAAEGFSAPSGCEEELSAIDFSAALPMKGADASFPKIGEGACGGNSADRQEALRPFLLEMQKALRASLQRKDPFYPQSSPQGSMIHAAFDYHSFLHGRWAELYVARQLGDAASIAQAKKEFPLSQIENEIKALKIDFGSNPYAGVWFAQFLKERVLSETDPRAKKKLLAWKEELENISIKFIFYQKNWNKEKFPVLLDGKHDDPSFLLTILKSTVSNERIKAELAKAEAIVAPVADGKNIRPGAFFAPASFRRVVVGEKASPRIGNAAERALAKVKMELATAGEKAYRPIDMPDDLPWSPLFVASHAAAEEVTAGWAMAAEPSQCDEWRRGLNEILSRPDFWKTSFLHSHYVPQFMLYGLGLKEQNL